MSAMLRWMLCAALLITLPCAVHAGEAEVPSVVWEAVAAGKPVEETHWTFIQTVKSGETELIARFDPQAAEGEEWQLVSPQGDAVTKDVTAAFEGIVESAKTQMPLGYLKLPGTLAPGGILEEAEPNTIIYRYRPEGMDAKAMRGELTIRTDRESGPWVERVRIFAEASYKPNFMTRITRFEQVAEYHLVAGLPVLRSAVTAVQGRAFFSSFEDEVSVTVSEVEIVE